MRKYIVPAAKRVGIDLLEFAVPEVAEVVSGRKNFKTAAKSVGRQTLRKQLGSGSRKRKRAIGGTEFAYGSKFWYRHFVAVTGNLGGKVPVVDDVLSSHEQEFYPTISLDGNCIEFEFQTDQNY